MIPIGSRVCFVRNTRGIRSESLDGKIGVLSAYDSAGACCVKLEDGQRIWCQEDAIVDQDNQSWENLMRLVEPFSGESV